MGWDGVGGLWLLFRKWGSGLGVEGGGGGGRGEAPA